MKRSIAYIILFFIVFNSWSQDSYRAVSRYDYYTDEDNASIAIWIPDSRKDVSVGVDIVYEFDHIYRGESVIPGQFNFFDIPMDRLHAGENEVTVSYYENKKWIFSDKVNVKLLAPHFNAVQIDRVTGSLIVEGMPFFPFGF